MDITSIPGIGPYLPYITTAVTVAAAVATVLPAPSATSPAWYRGAYSVVNWVALNLGRAKNTGT